MIVTAVGFGAIYLIADVALRNMLGAWQGNPEFSHAPLIPLIAAFLVWQQKDELQKLKFSGSWSGVALALFGALLAIAGKSASLYTVSQLGAVAAFYGVVLAGVGPLVFRRVWAPLFILLLMVPLPDFLLHNFSAEMQLISSRLGVWFMRLFGVSVYLEGNVIDLGVYRLQVAEACDGLRYMFPLMTLGFIMAYFFKAALWKRVLLFLSSFPITILMNSLRVGTIGILVDHWGIEMAEGFLHEFQGWAVFMVSFALMVLLMIGLSKIGADARPWREVFGLGFPAPTPKGVPRVARPVPASLIAACVVLMAGAAVSLRLPHRTEATPDRASFVEFPAVIGAYSGRRDSLEEIYLDQLKLDDYLLANYRGTSSTAPPVNLYVAWYDSQQAGRSVHSPRACLPGGGWQIQALSQVEVPGIAVNGQPLRVNRALIALGANRQLVYYWFQQRGRVITNEYLVKWYLFWDSLTRRRTDGALVRLTVPLAEGEAPEQADRQLADFAREAMPRLRAHIPN